MDAKFKYELLDDNQLIKLISRSDQRAFSALYYRYSRFIYAVAYKLSQDRVLAEDILQEIYLNIWDKRDTTSFHSNFKGYLCTIIKHKVLNYIKREKIIQSKLSDIQSTALRQSPTDADAEQRECREIIEAALGSLSEIQQHIIRLKQEGYSNEEIAKQMSMPISTIKTYYTRSLKSMRKIISILVVFFCAT